MSNYGPETATGGEFVKVCPACGQTFRTNNERQVYCTNTCKRQAHNKRYYGAHKPEVVAAVITRRRRKREAFDDDAG